MIRKLGKSCANDADTSTYAVKGSHRPALTTEGFFETVKTSGGNVMPSRPKRLTLPSVFCSEVATISGLHESLIEALRFCMMNKLLDHQSLRMVDRHVEAARDHLFEAESTSARAALLSIRDSALG